MHAFIIGLRVVHIVTGVFWAGAVFFINALLLPSMGAAGAAGGRVLSELKRRRHHEALLATSTLTILSGSALLWLDSGGLSNTWLRAPIGLALSIGGVAALTGYLVGLLAARPLAIRMEEVQMAMMQAPSDALRQSYGTRLGEIRQRLTLFGRLTAGCLGVAVIAMASARYL